MPLQSELSPGLIIPVFAITLDLGIAFGLALTLHLGAKRRFPRTLTLDAAIAVLAVSFVGGRLLYVILHWTEYQSRPTSVLYVWEGGLSLLGALTVGALAAPRLLSRLGLPIAATLDAVVPGVALAQAVGRLGCISSGCAAGRALEDASWLPALIQPDASGWMAPRFPSQLVEASGELALALLLVALWRRWPPHGTVAATYLIGYGLLRLVTEPLRADSTLIGPIPFAMVWSLLAVAIGVFLLRRATAARHAPGGSLKYVGR